MYAAKGHHRDDPLISSLPSSFYGISKHSKAGQQNEALRQTTSKARHGKKRTVVRIGELCHRERGRRSGTPLLLLPVSPRKGMMEDGDRKQENRRKEKKKVKGKIGYTRLTVNGRSTTDIAEYAQLFSTC